MLKHTYSRVYYVHTTFCIVNKVNLSNNRLKGGSGIGRELAAVKMMYSNRVFQNIGYYDY